MKIPSALKFLLQLKLIAVMLAITSMSWAETQESKGSGDPRQIVSQLQGSLIKAMREGGKLGYQGRYDLLAPAVDQTHDLDFIARTTLGGNWTQLSAEQQRTFTDVF